jgi:hypothetical protein
MEKLHFKVSSPESFIKLACTMLFEKTDAHKEWGPVWNEAFAGIQGEELFLKFTEELFPAGCTIGENELNKIMARAVNFVKNDPLCIDAKNSYDKKRFPYWVYFIPERKLFVCEFAGHEETIIRALALFFGKSVIDYNLQALQKFIVNSFEIRSSRSSVSSIAEDVQYIQESAFLRSIGAYKE